MTSRRQASASCKIVKCRDKTYSEGTLCATHRNMQTIARKARLGEDSKAEREYFLKALKNGYG